VPGILLVEDEESFVEALSVGLRREGFDVHVARDGKQALALFDHVHPDLVLLDVMLPELSGIDVCKALRARSRVPIVMVSAKTSEVDTIVGLEVGADDYVTKPYRLRELVARVRAVLRRRDDTAERAPDDAVTVGDVTLDVARHEVVVRGEHVHLPLREFEVLHLLLDNVGRVVTRETLMDRVWGYDYVGDSKTLDVHIKRVRGRIGDGADGTTRIVTVRGVGYKYVDAAPRPLTARD
jgi:two-component system response regulator RegX3